MKLLVRCAGCGRALRPRRYGPGWSDSRGITYCTAVMRDGVLVSCDYHYVAGEEQRHFREPSDDLHA